MKVKMEGTVLLALLGFFCAAWPSSAQIPHSHPVTQHGVPAAPVPPAAAPSAAAAAGGTNAAANPNNPLRNGATERLDSVMKNLTEAMKANPFFQLAGLSMQIRELAITNPDALKEAGVYVVPAPKTLSKTEQISDTLASQALEEIIQGKNSPAVKIQAKEEKAAKSEYDQMMDPSNQASLEKALPPQERMRYDQQRIAQIRNQISVNKTKVEKARKAIRKQAEAREQ